MEITLTIPAGQMLFKFFFNVDALNADSNGTSKFAPYTATDEIATAEIAAITKWLRTKMFTALPEGAGYNIVPFKGKIKDNYVKRLKQVAQHYEGAGRLLVNCEPYAELMMCLDGKEPNVEDIEG